MFLHWMNTCSNTIIIKCNTMLIRGYNYVISRLKKSRGGFDTLQASLEKTSGGSETKSYNDDRYWKIDLDKTGNGYAVVRFLPASQGEDMPWVQYFDHGFQGQVDGT